MSHVGIVELGSYCATAEAVHHHLFVVTGNWATDVAAEPDPAAQQLFAVATHRHAWHEQLWSARRPATPALDGTAAAPRHVRLADDTPVEHRLQAYRAAIGTIRDADAELARRCDRDLDPSTWRVIELVGADLTALTARVDRIAAGSTSVDEAPHDRSLRAEP